MDDETVANFMAIADVNETVARSFLEITNGDLSQAVTLYYDNPEMAVTLGQPSASASASGSAQPQAAAASGTAAARPARRNLPHSSAGREDEHGVIHIDSDDENDVQMLEDDTDREFDFDEEEGAAAEAVTVARTAQEEEDAAIAKRLQEELYAENTATSDGIRAPIGRTTETLVAPTYGLGHVDDDDGGVDAAVLEHMRRRRQAARPQVPNPFSQLWESGEAPVHSGTDGLDASTQTSRQARLAELYRPPYDLISHLSWDDARADGREQKKWILANIQDMSDFNCQVLNRDIWKDEAVRQIVQESFIFLQYAKEDPRASQYIQYYLSEGRHENPDNYPHVAIIDPRTGEQVKVWSGRPFPDALDFHAQLAEFLDRYSLAANSKNPVAKTKPRQQVKDVGRMTEEEMLQMAMQNSLETAANGSVTKPSIDDPDELTAADSYVGKGKERADDDLIDLSTDSSAAEAATAEASSSQSSFSQIPADRPHTEPANDPATTTRIQFRHAAGRIIRRFATSDPVARIYEWLKAEPLEGKEGVEFELKVMPQGKDLIQELDQTIEEAGLKQATVMIEYIQD